MAYLSYLQPSIAKAVVTRSVILAPKATVDKPYIGAVSTANGGLTSIKLAVTVTEEKPYIGAVGTNGGLTSIKFGCAATVSNPYIGSYCSLNPQSTRPTTGLMWPRGYN